MKWTFDHYVMVRWSFVESWKAAVKQNPANPKAVSPEEACEFLKKSEAGRNWALPPEQSIEYFRRVQKSLVKCGMINTPVIRSQTAEPSLVDEGFAIRIKPGTLMQRQTANTQQTAQAHAQRQQQQAQMLAAQRAKQNQMTPLQKQQVFQMQVTAIVLMKSETLTCNLL